MRTRMIVEWIALLATALVMGVLWGTWFALSRSIATIEPVVFLGIGKTSIANLAAPMRVLMPLTIISLIVLLVLALRQRLAQSWLLWAALACMVGVIAITLSIAVPIDNQIKTWTVQSLPTDWMELRDRWQAAHTIRTFLSIVAVAALAWHALSVKSKPQDAVSK